MGVPSSRTPSSPHYESSDADGPKSQNRHRSRRPSSVRSSPNFSRPSNGRVSSETTMANNSGEVAYWKRARGSDESGAEQVSAADVAGGGPGSARQKERELEAPYFKNGVTLAELESGTVPREFAARMPSQISQLDTIPSVSDLQPAAKPASWPPPSAHNKPATFSYQSTLVTKQPERAFGQRIFEAGRAELLYDVQSGQLKHGVVDLVTLQRMSQHVLKQRLAEQVKVLGQQGQWIEIGVQQTLHEYCESVRDLEYMEAYSQRKQGDPFLISAQRPLESEILEDAGLVLPPAGPGQHPQLQARRRFPHTPRWSMWRMIATRGLMALGGGLSLLLPFVVMVLLGGDVARLVVTAAAVMLFSGVMAGCNRLSPGAASLMTAAYAAALVIFVGTHPVSVFYQHGM